MQKRMMKTKDPYPSPVTVMPDDAINTSARTRARTRVHMHVAIWRDECPPLAPGCCRNGSLVLLLPPPTRTSYSSRVYTRVRGFHTRNDYGGGRRGGQWLVHGSDGVSSSTRDRRRRRF